MGARIGIGLGVGLGALFVIATTAALYVRRARQKQREEFRRRTVGLRAMSETA